MSSVIHNKRYVFGVCMNCAKRRWWNAYHF